MDKHDSDLGEGLEKKTYDIEPKELPVFNPDEPIVCPKCGAPFKEENWKHKHSWWIDSNFVWHIKCYNCEHEWKAKAERKEE